MRHDIQLVAKNHRLSKADFVSFCGRESVQRVFSLEITKGITTVSTSATESLVNAFYTFSYLGSSGRQVIADFCEEINRLQKSIQYCEQAISACQTEAWERKEYLAVKQDDEARLRHVLQHVISVTKLPYHHIAAAL